jgi:hypothetical protein
MAVIIKTYKSEIDKVELYLHIKKEILQNKIKMYFDAELISHNNEYVVLKNELFNGNYINLKYENITILFFSYLKSKGFRWESNLSNNKNKISNLFYNSAKELKEKYIQLIDNVPSIQKYFYERMMFVNNIKFLYEIDLKDVLD